MSTCKRTKGGRSKDDKRELAIAALLSSTTHQEAADKSGVSLATLRRWMKQDRFQRAYMEARHEILSTTIGRLLSVCGEAVQTLSLNLAADRPADQIRAACSILNTAFKGFFAYDKRIDELVKRLDNLERNEPKGTIEEAP